MTEAGTLSIKGEGLHVTRLDLERQEVDIEGKVDSLIYSQGLPKPRGRRNAEKAVSMTHMSSYMRGELLLAADAFLAGVFLAVCYDILRIFRNIADHSPLWVGIEDILYWCASGIYLFKPDL